MIEVGEYVRTKSGKIGIFKKYAEEGVQQWFTMLQNGTLYTTATRAIVNRSKNIIDLIEVGDYVNGKLIHKIDKGQNYCYLYYGNCKTFVDYQIKTILTKEMYELNCYTVERKEEC